MQQTAAAAGFQQLANVKIRGFLSARRRGTAAPGAWRCSDQIGDHDGEKHAKHEQAEPRDNRFAADFVFDQVHNITPGVLYGSYCNSLQSIILIFLHFFWLCYSVCQEHGILHSLPSVRRSPRTLIS